MSSGYNDDRDRYGDDDRGFDRPDTDRQYRRELAQARVRIPAVLLIVCGVLAILLAASNFVRLPDLPAQLDAQLAPQIEKIEQDPKLTDDQKKEQKEMIEKIKRGMEQAMGPLYALNVLVGLLVLIGGVKMLNLSGRGLAILASVLAMLPVVNCFCCLLGLPVGIWALVVLSNADVKAAFAANSRGMSGPPDAY